MWRNIVSVLILLAVVSTPSFAVDRSGFLDYLSSLHGVKLGKDQMNKIRRSRNLINVEFLTRRNDVRRVLEDSIDQLNWSIGKKLISNDSAFPINTAFLVLHESDLTNFPNLNGWSNDLRVLFGDVRKKSRELDLANGVCLTFGKTSKDGADLLATITVLSENAVTKIGGACWIQFVFTSLGFSQKGVRDNIDSLLKFDGDEVTLTSAALSAIAATYCRPGINANTFSELRDLLISLERMQCP